MVLLDKILKWTEEKLPLWQRDAARRLFQQQSNLSINDYAELYALLKAEYNLPNPLELLPEPLMATHLPKSLQTDQMVILKTLRDLKHVNRIASGQKLHFYPTGMTVIYGGNGSGKSGYVRVMKRACRARDQSETVLTDARDPAASPLNIPEATFEIEINGTPKSVQWSLNNKSPDELATLAVFDSHCARSYLTAERDAAYLPYGLDVVENLADKVLPELTRRLCEDINSINIDCQPFEHLRGETKVGRIVSTLNDKTDPAQVNALGTLNEIEVTRVKELDIALAESDPRAKVKELRLSADRLKSLGEKIECSLAWVSDAAIKKLKEFDDVTTTINQAEKQAADVLQSGESLLLGTGGLVWKKLFDAARKFSTEAAYPEQRFPHINDNALCLLCQQTLNDSGARMKRFEAYIQNDIAKSAEDQRQKLAATKTKIERANLSIDLDKSLIDWLGQFDDAIAPIVSNFQRSIDDRRIWILRCLESHVWEITPPALSDNPRKRLRNLAAGQIKAARLFAKAVGEAKKKVMEEEREELRARQNLSISLGAVLALIERMKIKSKLKCCENGLKTKPISDKSKEFASGAITATLKKALDDEFKELGISHIKTILKDRNDKGKVKHQLILDLPRSNKLGQILSEGEQRAIALGSFLAELRLANHGGGIIFDDPVSSLDHKHRGRVAARLALVSKQRQVLVFTHDLVFLYQLRDKSEKLNEIPSFRFLEVIDGYYGNVSEGLPWDHKNYKERIDSLEKAQKKLEKLPWPPYPSEALGREIIQQYSFFRATIERVVQDFVLNGTVQRFDDYIQVKNLEKVIGLAKAEVDEVSRLYQRCNDLVEAHDPSSIKDEPPPNPDELNQDITDLKKLIQIITNRRKGKLSPLFSE